MAKNPRLSKKQQIPRPSHNKTEKTCATQNRQQRQENGLLSHITTTKSEKSPTSLNRYQDSFQKYEHDTTTNQIQKP
jgi:hypothetical protein